MNLTPINPYQLIEYLNGEVKKLAQANAEIVSSLLSAEITDISKNGIEMTASIDIDEETKQDVVITIKKKNGKGNSKIFNIIAERLRFLKEFAINTMENIKDDSMD